MSSSMQYFTKSGSPYQYEICKNPSFPSTSNLYRFCGKFQNNYVLLSTCLNSNDYPVTTVQKYNNETDSWTKLTEIGLHDRQSNHWYQYYISNNVILEFDMYRQANNSTNHYVYAYYGNNNTWKSYTLPTLGDNNYARYYKCIEYEGDIYCFVSYYTGSAQQVAIYKLTSGGYFSEVTASTSADTEYGGFHYSTNSSQIFTYESNGKFIMKCEDSYYYVFTGSDLLYGNSMSDIAVLPTIEWSYSCNGCLADNLFYFTYPDYSYSSNVWRSLRCKDLDTNKQYVISLNYYNYLSTMYYDGSNVFFLTNNNTYKIL